MRTYTFKGLLQHLITNYVKEPTIKLRTVQKHLALSIGMEEDKASDLFPMSAIRHIAVQNKMQPLEFMLDCCMRECGDKFMDEIVKYSNAYGLECYKDNVVYKKNNAWTPEISSEVLRKKAPYDIVITEE